MNKVENLRETTDLVLRGLTADEKLRNRILKTAAGPEPADRGFFLRPVPVLCAAVAVLVIGVLALNGLRPVGTADPGELTHIAAGQTVVPVSGHSDSLIGNLQFSVEDIVGNGCV